MSRDIFATRTAVKPFEYPEVTKFSDAIQASPWNVTEWFPFTADVQDFHTKLDQIERVGLERTLLCVAQVEVKVKRWWGDIGLTLPKTEISNVGHVFAYSEVVHFQAYSELLDLLGLNEGYEQILTVPAIQGRVEYLEKYLKGAAHNTQEAFTLKLALFSLFVENVSLFSQFYIVKSYKRHRNLFKDIDNVIQATQREETLHALFGSLLINIIKEEHPEWFNDDFYAMLKRASLKAYEAECRIIDWIFEEGTPDYLSTDELKAFIRHRFNWSLSLIGAEPTFEVSPDEAQQFEWFNNQLLAEVEVDFFHKRSTDYTAHQQAFDPDDLF